MGETIRNESLYSKFQSQKRQEYYAEDMGGKVYR